MKLLGSISKMAAETIFVVVLHTMNRTSNIKQKLRQTLDVSLDLMAVLITRYRGI